MDFYARGIQAFEQGRARTARNRLAELSSAALSAPVEQRGQFAPQIAALDPDAGFSFEQGIQRQQQAMQAESERKIGNMAKLLSVAPPEARGGLYARIAPGLRDMGYEAPEAWSDDMMPVVQQLAGGGQPQQGRGPITLAPGSVVFDPMTGREIYRNEPQAKSQPIARIPDGMGGEIAGYNTPNGFVPIGDAPASPALPYRVNLQGLQPESVALARQQIEADMGRSLSDSEWAQISAPQAAPRIGRNPPPQRAQFRQLSPQEVAAEGFPQGTIVERNTQTGETKVIRTPDAGTLKEQREIRAKAPRLNAVVRSLSNISSALGDLNAGASTMGLAGTGPIDQFVTGFTPEGGRLNQAVSDLQANLMALTRVPGIGTQSDLETRLDSLRYPGLERGQAANNQALEGLAFFISDLADAYEISGDEKTAAMVRAIRPQLRALTEPQAAQPAPAAPASSGFRVLSERPAGG